MTLKVRIQVPKYSGPYEAKVSVGVGENVKETILEPGDELETYVHSGAEIHIVEVPFGTAAAKRLTAG